MGSSIGVSGVLRYARRGTQRATATLRALPDFAIIGAAKAGTTSLFEYLSEHPMVVPADLKEVHFFDLQYDRGVGWYRSHFPLRAQLRGGRVTGEGSPYYLFHPESPKRMRAVTPNTRLIVLLREPVARTFSHYRHYVRNKQEDRTFEEAVAQELDELDLALVHARARDDNKHVRHTHRRFSLLTRSLYADQLERWFAEFPRRQVLVLKSESLFADPVPAYRTVTDFLGLPPYDGVRFEVHNASPTPMPLSNEMRDRLTALFAEPNRRLVELLGPDFAW
ncbi:MAG: (Heparan sulfate)-glucosamine 3-sulfotransferase 1 [Actinomycetia bacterium]|nr:(Heparan sulfate)-glucosamine 3-sulfotransferase 1 [Actinomycetes bacterium]